MSSLSETLAEYVTTTDATDLPTPAVEEAKRLVLDLLGVALAATEMAPFPRTLKNLITELGGKQEATVFRTSGKVPALQAVLVNAAYAHALDMDDGHRYGALHPGTVIIPAALASAEMVHADSHKLVLGIVMGYEVMIRLGMAINPASLNRGFHPTGTTGSVGSAVTCGCIMGLDPGQMVGALGLAGLCSAGLLQVNHESSAAAVKPLNPARAAQGGLLAAMLAKRGSVGPTAIFEGQDGFFRAFSDEVNPHTLVADLGQRFEIQNIYTKFYAACRHAHAAVDAALSLYRQHELNLDQIDSIQVATYPQVLRLAGIAKPTSISGARFSTAFSIALALHKGDAGATRYTQANLDDPALRAVDETDIIDSQSALGKTVSETTGRYSVCADQRWSNLKDRCGFGQRRTRKPSFVG